MPHRGTCFWQLAAASFGGIWNRFLVALRVSHLDFRFVLFWPRFRSALQGGPNQGGFQMSFHSQYLYIVLAYI